mmetsp:Transcript_24037/g.83422  ORF Transcript_24037/g.83422 Transcript_24037/m.83422 type:complete len:212 (+) Transcript_24037:541-1176(+)
MRMRSSKAAGSPRGVDTVMDTGARYGDSVSITTVAAAPPALGSGHEIDAGANMLTSSVPLRGTVEKRYSGSEPRMRVPWPSQHVPMFVAGIFTLCSNANCRMPPPSGTIWLMTVLKMLRSICSGYSARHGRSRCSRWFSLIQNACPHSSPVDRSVRLCASSPRQVSRKLSGGYTAHSLIATLPPAGKRKCARNMSTKPSTASRYVELAVSM